MISDRPSGRIGCAAVAKSSTCPPSVQMQRRTFESLGDGAYSAYSTVRPGH